MKKLLLVLILICSTSVLLAAQDINDRVRNAVVSLGAARLTSPIEVSIGGIYLEGTQSVSGLSRYLSHRINANVSDNDRLKPVAPTRGISRPVAGGPRKGVITGTYLQRGDNVDVTLQLIGDPGGEIIDTKQFVFTVAELKQNGINILPDNLKSQEDAKTFDDIFSPPSLPNPGPNTPGNLQVLEIAVWPNSDTNTFFEGDEVKINIESNKNCYFKVYSIDVNRKREMIYPNPTNRNNQLQANVMRTIPDLPIQFIVQSPFGQDTIMVFASTQPFVNIEAEFVKVQQATRGMIEDMSRGIGVQIVPNNQPAEFAISSFSYTSLSAAYFDESYHYRKPVNIAEAVQNMRAEALLMGGSFTGNEQEGTFTVSGTTGRYQVIGDTVTVNLRYTGNQFAEPLTRGVKAAHNFTIDKPQNITLAVQAVKSGIEGKGGTFTGNEQQGTFNASGITGQYNVADRVNVVIIEKPALIPNSLIEREVRNYFSGR